MNSTLRLPLFATSISLAGWLVIASLTSAESKPADTANSTQKTNSRVALIGTGDWAQWGGGPARNNVPEASNIPTEWDVESGKNIKWSAPLGSQTYGNPVVANGKVYVGTNNGAGYLKRFPENVDLGVLLCFDEATGKFLWQHSSKKLPTGRVHDWPQQGICCSPLIEGDRGWFVTSRGEIVCFDTEGFYDNENDGPYQSEEKDNKDEADVIWAFNMMTELGVSQHNMCSCSVTSVGDTLLVNTSNGLDETHINLPAPSAPSFIAVDKSNGKVLWTDASPGANILHGQWSSPAFAVIDGQPQAIFAGGDGWVYSFDPRGENGESKLLWKFDCNPKDSKWILGGRGTRNNLIATPVVYKNRVFIASGQDPEHGEGVGHLWCIDPTKRGDVSPELVYNVKDRFKKPIPHKRIQAADTKEGDAIRPNPNSAMIWHFSKFDSNGNGSSDFEEELHRSIGTCTIKDDLIYIADFSGIFHCIDANNGKPYWSYDMFAASWGSAVVADGHVYIGDEDGEVSVFKHSSDPKKAMKNGEPLNTISMNNSVYTTPIIANNVLYIANRNQLFAISKGAQLNATTDK